MVTIYSLHICVFTKVFSQCYFSASFLTFLAMHCLCVIHASDLFCRYWRGTSREVTKMHHLRVKHYYASTYLSG